MAPRTSVTWIRSRWRSQAGEAPTDLPSWPRQRTRLGPLWQRVAPEGGGARPGLSGDRREEVGCGTRRDAGAATETEAGRGGDGDARAPPEHSLSCSDKRTSWRPEGTTPAAKARRRELSLESLIASTSGSWKLPSPWQPVASGAPGDTSGVGHASPRGRCAPARASWGGWEPLSRGRSCPWGFRAGCSPEGLIAPLGARPRASGALGPRTTSDGAGKLACVSGRVH